MVLAQVTIAYTFQFAILGGINTGVITCLFSLQAVIQSVWHKYAFNEAISLIRWIGIFLMFGCLACLLKLAQIEASNPDPNYDLPISEGMYAFLAILIAFAQALIFTTKAFVMRLN